MRKQNVDQIIVEEMYTKNDIIRAKIFALNESKNIILKTDEEDLGVIFSISDVGQQLSPISERKMEDP